MLGMQKDNPYFEGFVLEFNSNREGKKTKIRVTNIKRKEVTIKSKEYRSMGY